MIASGNTGVDADFTRKAAWSTIDWHVCCREVRKLQARIAKPLLIRLNFMNAVNFYCH